MRYIETIKIVDGEFCNIDYHIKRMERTIGLQLPIDLYIAPEYCKGTVKYRIIYNSSSIIQTEYIAYTLPHIKSLRLIECNNIDYSLKYEDRTKINTLRSICKSNEDILITQNGNITDTSFCNVIFENNNGLFTPSTPLLNGTKRQLLINTGKICECQIRIDDIGKYNRIMLINSMLEIGDVILETTSLQTL